MSLNFSKLYNSGYVIQGKTSSKSSKLLRDRAQTSALQNQTANGVLLPSDRTQTSALSKLVFQT